MIVKLKGTLRPRSSLIHGNYISNSSIIINIIVNSEVKPLNEEVWEDSASNIESTTNNWNYDETTTTMLYFDNF